VNVVALFASLLLATPPQPPATPEPDAIMQRALAAVGPAQDVSSLRTEGEVRVEGHPDRTVRFELLSIAGSPRRLLLRQRLPDGRDMGMGCQGDVGWMRRPGDARATPIEPVAVSATVAGLLPSRMVLAVADRFPHRKSAPAGTFEGRNCLRLDVEDRDGVRGRIWFDAVSGRIAGIETDAKDAAQPASRLVFEAWGPAGALTVPVRLRMQRGDETLVTEFRTISVEPIPEAAFDPPPDVRGEIGGP
jgi:hypothetical protein